MGEGDGGWYLDVSSLVVILKIYYLNVRSKSESREGHLL